MSAVLDPIDVLDDEQHRTPTWEQYRKQRGTQDERKTIPKGAYDATLIETALVRRRDAGGFVIRMVCRTDRLGVFLVSWRGLSGDEFDPYALTDAQVKSLRKFADSMGIQTPAPAQQIVDALFEMNGTAVEARVVHTPAGVQTTLSRPGVAPSTSLIEGEIPSLQGAAEVAQQAHVKVLRGLGTVRLGLLQVAEGCFELVKGEGWSALGYESLSEYLAAPEVTLSRTEFYRSADIWKTYVLEGGLSPQLLAGAEASKLEVPLPALKQGLVDAETAASDASGLTRKDLRDRYRELLGGDVEPETPPTITVLEKTSEAEPVPASGTVGDDDGLVDELGEALSAANMELERLRHFETEVAAAATRERELREQVAEIQNEQLDVGVAAAARTVTRALQRVMDEVGDPKRRQMGKALRTECQAALDLAHQYELDAE